MRNPYDSRPITLDPGLTALALRARTEHDEHYPFVQAADRGRRWRLRLRAGLARRRQVTGAPRGRLCLTPLAPLAFLTQHFAAWWR